MDNVMITTSAGDWEGVQHRPHHFMRRAAGSGHTVIYIEPPVSLLGPLKNKQLVQNWRRWKNGLQQIDKHLYVLSPPPILPFGNKIRMVNRLNQRWIAKEVKKAMKQIGAQQAELYSFLPNSIDMTKHISFSRIYYDCVDDHAAFTGLIDPKLVSAMEQELMEKAHVCFATARQLLEDRQEWASDFHLVQNGAEYEHFARVQTETLLTPHDIANIPKPIIGFVGGVSDWIDLDLIAEAARKLADCSFVMIGPVDTSIDHFKSLKNVHFLGSKPYKNLPNYIQSFDACLIPFRMNKLTKSVNPIKMYEYLSAGKPVISTPLPEVVHYKDVIDIVTDADELVKVMRGLIEDPEIMNASEKISQRQSVGKENSWDARWQRVEEMIKSQAQ
ncbi:glycosyltransferase [Cytobacillus purgationiresistens]|uniref:Glycosyltransferase involved in cell wall biosynthesis n=1 Tax=Cytobacillus purgationiresistens TaxID=863449 RepID=A0ABU0ACX6_9BACI|nr:glycosyltransferase [Cytobacillus purgationiresistens]MDQ0269111.1 glycosyltransferase involved in cell wall biosynthesis [Cytobacillus purgationiresistens]